MDGHMAPAWPVTAPPHSGHSEKCRQVVTTGILGGTVGKGFWHDHWLPCGLGGQQETLSKAQVRVIVATLGRQSWWNEGWVLLEAASDPEGRS